MPANHSTLKLVGDRETHCPSRPIPHKGPIKGGLGCHLQLFPPPNPGPPTLGDPPPSFPLQGFPSYRQAGALQTPQQPSSSGLKAGVPHPAPPSLELESPRASPHPLRARARGPAPPLPAGQDAPRMIDRREGGPRGGTTFPRGLHGGAADLRMRRKEKSQLVSPIPRLLLFPIPADYNSRQAPGP